MNAKKKTNHLQKEADKIEQIPEHTNDGRDSQDKTIKAKRPRKNRFLARLRETWARNPGCRRSRTSLQKERSDEKLPTPNGINMEEELPEPSINTKEELQGPIGNNMEEEILQSSGTKEYEFPGPTINMEDSKAKVSTEEKEEEENDVEENQNIDTNNVGAQLVTESSLQQARQAELRRLNDLIHRLEVLCPQYNAIHLEILAEKKDINSQIQGLLEYHIQNHIQNYNAKDQQQQNREELESRVGDKDVKNKEDRVNGKQAGEQAKKISQLQEEADKIEQIPEHTNDGSDSQDKPNKAKRPRKNWFLACLRATWARITGCTRSRTSLQKERSDEKLPTPNGINMEDSKGRMQQARQAELRRLNDLIHTLEVLCPQYNAIHLEILAENKDINSQIQRLLEYHIQNHIQNYNAEDQQQQDREELESRVGDKDVKNKEDGVNGEQAGELQSKTEDNEASKGKEKDDDIMEYTTTVPLTLQSFTFHGNLGKGCFGEVYLARDTFHKESVAIKVVDKLKFILYECSFAERNILELSHESPFLIHGLAAFHTENCVYYVMELATRGNLREFLYMNGPLDHATIQFIISEVICGMQFLHKKGITHGDLKPENILLSTEGHVKITDFDFAEMDANESTTVVGAGAVPYTAPERLRCQKHGQGVDYFAIGVILYEMYTCKRPFNMLSFRDIMSAIQHYTPKYPEFLTPDTVNILQGLLHKDQHCRLGVKEDIRKHPYFLNINWEDVEARTVEPPAIITAESVDQNIYETLDYEEKPNEIRSKDQKIFKKFNFICPEWSNHYHAADTKSWMANLFAWMFEDLCPCCKAVREIFLS